MTEVSIRGLRKDFGDIVALNGISFDIADKEFVTLLGPTGAGKTTTLRSIVGLEKPDSGEISLNGHIINELTPGQRDMAFVSQHYALYPNYSVFDNIAFPLHKRKFTTAEKKEKVESVAKILHIDHLLQRKPDKLSGGEMQRVVIGRAMVRSPQLFLLDEPLSNLDAKLREELRFELKRLQIDNGATTLYVTHDQVEAMSMSDRIIVLYKGVIQQIGTPKEIYGFPANTLVSGFVGSPGMNLLETEYADGYLICDGAPKIHVPFMYKSVVKSGPYTLGIRPEEVKVASAGGSDIWNSEVYLVEALGHEQLVDFKIGKLRLRARIPAYPKVKVGETLSITLDPEGIRLFSPDGQLVKGEMK
jgi:ABC-type sugar transport system ATPase subunit